MKNITDKEKSNYYEMDESQIRLNIKSAHAYAFEKTAENAWNVKYYKRKYGKRQSPYSTGHIYILQNTSFPGIFKIGFTERLISERLHDINRSSGMITPWQVRDFFYCLTPYLKEQEIFEQLKEYRIENTEGFIAPYDTVRSVIFEVLGISDGDID
jgi:hypothetical protein